MRLQQALYAQLPPWARPDNPIVRYVRGQNNNRLWRLLLALIIGTVVICLLVISLIAHGSGDPLGTSGVRKWTVFEVAYFPLLVMQCLSLVLALLVASTAISSEQQRGTWEAFKMTSHGAELVMRARWAGVLYQLRGPILLLIIPRLIFAGLMLVDVTDYEGYHLDLYLYGIRPDMPLEGAILLLAALMTALLLQIPVMIGLNAALGLVISALFHARAAVFAARIVVLIAVMTVTAFVLQAGWHTLDDDPLDAAADQSSNAMQWINLLLMGTVGDQGLRYMDLETHLQTWADVDYSVLMGGALLLVVVVEIVLIRLLLGLAARRAARPLKE